MFSPKLARIILYKVDQKIELWWQLLFAKLKEFMELWWQLLFAKSKEFMELWWQLLFAKLKKFIRDEEEYGILRSGFSKKKRKLLVLDLNGLLADVVDKAPNYYTPNIRIRRKSVFKRPFCDDFLKFCFENFDVGIWTSRMKKNMDGLVDFLFGHMKHQVLFFWDQSHCTAPGLRIGQLGFETAENKKKPLYLKELKKLWKKHDAGLPWEDGVYNESNTLLLDDSPYKAILNPPHNAVFPKSYKFQHDYDNALGPGGDIRVYLEGLVMAENIQEYVEQHPFGQAPIASSSYLYRRVIDITTNSELTDKGGPSNHNRLFISGPKVKEEVFLIFYMKICTVLFVLFFGSLYLYSRPSRPT